MPTTTKTRAPRAPKAPAAPVEIVSETIPYVGALHYYADNSAVCLALAARVGADADAVRKPVRAIVLRGDATTVAAAAELVRGYLSQYDRELRTFKRTDPAYLACGPRTIDGRDAGRVERSRLERVFLAEAGALYGTPTPYVHAVVPATVSE